MPFSLVELRCLRKKVIVYYVITVPVLVHSIVYCYGITIHSSVSVLILFGQPKTTIRLRNHGNSESVCYLGGSNAAS